MTTDLEARLRRYGTTLDNANQHRSGVDSHPNQHPETSAVEVELGYVFDRPRNRSRSLVGAAVLIAAASVALVLVNQRHTDPQLPASAPETVTDQWPLRLTPGLTPWFEANDPITAAFGRPEPGPAQQRLRCTTWTTDSQTITCDSLTGEGYLPAVTYPGPDNNYVDISTLHSNIDAATYATNYSQGKDVGYEDTPLPQQDVTINGSSGRLIETANGIRRVTWLPQPGALVAVETGPGLTREDLLTIASNITATLTLPSIPLVLASTEIDSSSRQAVALGGVINGEICLTTTTGCTQVLQSTPEPGTVAAAAIYAQSTDFGIAGIATGDITTIQATHPDGSITDVHPTQQPIGTTQAFALITDTAVTLIGLDAAGNPIQNIEVTNVPRPAEDATPTTVTASTTMTPAGSVVCLVAGGSLRAVTLCNEELGGSIVESSATSDISFVMPVDPANPEHVAATLKAGVALNLPVREIDTNLLPTDWAPNPVATTYLVLGKDDGSYAS